MSTVGLTSTDGERYAALRQALARLAPHDHLCLVYESEEEQFATIVPYFRNGLERHEKCVYVADEHTVEEVLQALRAHGIPVDQARQSGALEVVTQREAYLRHGYFDPESMIGYMHSAVVAAKAAGYAGLRGAGEMTWMLAGDPGAERLMEYEAKLNYFFPTHECVGICQYNRNRFSDELIRDVIRTHPLVIYGGLVCRNHYYSSAGRVSESGAHRPRGGTPVGKYPTARTGRGLATAQRGAFSYAGGAHSGRGVPLRRSATLANALHERGHSDDQRMSAE